MIYTRARGAGKVAFEADKIADAKKVELDIANMKKSIDGQYTRLGAMSYQRFRATFPEAPEFADVTTVLWLSSRGSQRSRRS